jgi:hypothetical protein
LGFTVVFNKFANFLPKIGEKRLKSAKIGENWQKWKKLTTIRENRRKSEKIKKN